LLTVAAKYTRIRVNDFSLSGYFTIRDQSWFNKSSPRRSSEIGIGMFDRLAAFYQCKSTESKFNVNDVNCIKSQLKAVA